MAKTAEVVPEPAVISVDEAIAHHEAELAELRKPVPIEFPKSVTREGHARVFNSRAEQDAAGPVWADDVK